MVDEYDSYKNDHCTYFRLVNPNQDQHFYKKIIYSPMSLRIVILDRYAIPISAFLHFHLVYIATIQSDNCDF